MEDIAVVLLLGGLVFFGFKTKMGMFTLIASMVSLYVMFQYTQEPFLFVVFFGLAIWLLYLSFWGLSKGGTK